MKAPQPELRAIPQFDSGRWKVRLELVPLSAARQTNHEHNLYEIAAAILCMGSRNACEHEIYFAKLITCKTMLFEKNVDEKIKEAITREEFDNLPGKGKPIDLDAYFATPEHLRMAYSILKSADIIPDEMGRFDFY